MYYIRNLESKLLKAVEQFPVVTLTGPRQAGKTTTLKKLFSNSYKYVTLDSPEIFRLASEDPRQFLSIYKSPVIIDEVQKAPELLSYIKEMVDNNRDKNGQFIITGSQNLLLSQKVSESLAGRTAVLKLLPFTYREVQQNPAKAFPWEIEHLSTSGTSVEDYWNLFIRGFYPGVINNDIDINLWHSSYIQTYIERDVRSIKQISDLLTFQNFLIMLASRSGQLLNLANISRDLGVTLNTCKSWLNILEATYQVIVLRPYFENVGKRLIKTPKVYFTDTGTLCHLLRISESAQASMGPFAGAIFETAVVGEIYKTLLSRGIDPRIYFWRTSSGTEVDMIISEGLSLIPLEIKSSATVNKEMAKNVKVFMRDYDKSSDGYIITLGDMILPVAHNITALGFASL